MLQIKIKIKIILNNLIPNRIIIWQNKHKSGLFSLTFDDGPNDMFTAKFLKILKKYGAKATFFFVGEKIEHNKNIVYQVISEGHEIANHTYNHNKWQMGPINNVREEILRTENLLRQFKYDISLYRPPHGILSIRSLIYCIRHKIITVMWVASIFECANFINHNEEKKIKKFMNGKIIVLHDNNEDELEKMEKVLKYCYDIGMRCVKVSELI